MGTEGRQKLKIQILQILFKINNTYNNTNQYLKIFYSLQSVFTYVSTLLSPSWWESY